MEAIYLVLYLQHLGISTGSRVTVEEVVHAFAWILQSAELLSPTNDPFVKAVLGGLCRILALPTVKKRPFASEMLNAVVQTFKPILAWVTFD